MDQWRQVIEANLTGVWLTSKYLLAHMLETRRGYIVNNYAASKGGVIAMTHQMAIDYEAFGIRVHAVCPGELPTEMVRNSYALARVQDKAVG